MRILPLPFLLLACTAAFDVTVNARESDHNRLAFFVSWTTDIPTTGTLTIDCGADFREAYLDDEPATEHRFFVMGLVAQSDCSAAVEAFSDAGRSVSSTQAFTVGRLPTTLPSLEQKTGEASSMNPGWTLFNLTNEEGGFPLAIVLVDEQGRIRWYEDQLTNQSGLDTVVRLVDGGILIGGIVDTYTPSIIDWQGEELWAADIIMHHDIVPISNGNMLYLGEHGEHECPDGLTSDTVNEIDPDTNETVDTWWLCDHYQPTTAFDDWDHLNAIEPFPGEEALLLSSRHQSALFKVDRVSGEVLWKLGQEGDITLDDPFLQQHAPELQSNGNILLFDNGNDERPYSRLLELTYDESDGTAEVVWSFRPDPDIYGWSWGDADRLANGNTLGTFGHVDGEAHLIEVTAAGEEVWHLVIPEHWGAYRADRVDIPERIVPLAQ